MKIKKETRREKRLREKEEQRRAALELDDQITINLNDDGKSSKKKSIRRIYRRKLI